jgi:hypothetical protein
VSIIYDLTLVLKSRKEVRLISVFPTCIPVDALYAARKEQLEKLFASYHWPFYYWYTLYKTKNYYGEMAKILRKELGPSNIFFLFFVFTFCIYFFYLIYLRYRNTNRRA